ncbi:hypothetical protein YK48G_18810 [Lentilactobacillus fungorum]|uniref:UPF0547 domain-containing protein n=1 Tax=Lentilactobacillus fungorum TaxID=2201250 RepID=A0ABQ3W2F3_9LACO|nr:zinc ribbon domain-containing protein [Lentilactobacillus fungorum]GHP14456.1 hypothetical protein YK48G_18810 [Lentilactobacillus fungorum]
MNGWVKFGIVWLIYMMMPDYGFVMKTVVGMVAFLILDVLFPDKAKKSEQSSNQVMPSSSTHKPQSEQLIVDGKHMKVCPSCNAKVSADANWCPQCGHQFKK